MISGGLIPYNQQSTKPKIKEKQTQLQKILGKLSFAVLLNSLQLWKSAKTPSCKHIANTHIIVIGDENLGQRVIAGVHETGKLPVTTTPEIIYFRCHLHWRTAYRRCR